MNPNDTNTFVFFRISISGGKPRKVIISLYTKDCPKTCQNFIRLCSSPTQAKRPNKSFTASKSKISQSPTYRNTEFHRIISNFMVQGGDYQNFDGTGGESYNGGTFPDESFAIKHDSEGIVSMANRGKDTNGSQFFITLKPTPHLDGKHVAFGRVTEGMGVIHEIAKVETEKESGRPIMLERVIIVDCGVGNGDDSNGSDNDESDSDDKASKKNRKRKNKYKKKKKQKRDKSFSESDDSDEICSSTKKKRKKRKYRTRDRIESYSTEDDDDDDDEPSKGRRQHKRKKKRKRSYST